MELGAGVESTLGTQYCGSVYYGAKKISKQCALYSVQCTVYSVHSRNLCFDVRRVCSPYTGYIAWQELVL